MGTVIPLYKAKGTKVELQGAALFKLLRKQIDFELECAQEALEALAGEHVPSEPGLPTDVCDDALSRVVILADMASQALRYMDETEQVRASS